MPPNINPQTHTKMAKIYGLFGAMTGKLADAVMVVRNGEQLVRKYQPVVFNPSTPAQIASRAKLKMMAQLSEVLANGIAFRRKGTVTARNYFVSKNYRFATFDTTTSQADIDLLSLDLTGGVIGMPAVSVTRVVGGFSAELQGTVDADAVVYVTVQRGDDSKLRFVSYMLVTDPGALNTFPLPEQAFTSSLTGVVYAYGIRFNNENAKARYLSLLAENNNGYLEVIRTAAETDYSLTETVATAITTAQP